MSVRSDALFNISRSLSSAVLGREILLNGKKINAIFSTRQRPPHDTGGMEYTQYSDVEAKLVYSFSEYSYLHDVGEIVTVTVIEDNKRHRLNVVFSKRSGDICRLRLELVNG